MASFLNQKEEVLSVELTKHGRKLLGLGIFKPVYFEFFDDSVIYDVRHADKNFTEDSNSSQDRILFNSFNLRCLNVLTEETKEPLGSSDAFLDYAPSWDLTVLNGKLDNSAVSSSYYKNVFTSSCQYFIELKQKEEANSNFSTFEIDENRIVEITDDYLLIDLKEENVSDDYKNFEIEVFTFDEINGGETGGLKRKLTFLEKNSNIIDGILFDDEELPDRFSNYKLSTGDVDFFLDVLVDEEIDRDIITSRGKAIEELVKGTYSSNFDGITKKEDC